MDAKKVIAVGVAGLLVGGLGGAMLFPVTNEVPVVTEKVVEVQVPVVSTVVETETVEVLKEVEKIVEVDNGNLAKVMDYVQDNVDEDLTVEYILFEVESKIESEAFVRSNLISLLNDNDFFDDDEVLGDYRKSEVSIRKISDAVVLDKDYENKDLTLSYEVKVRAKKGSNDAEYFSFNIVLPYEDGKFVEEDVEVELI